MRSSPPHSSSAVSITHPSLRNQNRPGLNFGTIRDIDGRDPFHRVATNIDRHLDDTSWYSSTTASIHSLQDSTQSVSIDCNSRGADNKMSYATPEVEMLDSMSYGDLEAMKQHLETVRQRILLLQNAQSAIFKLPGELRNKIFWFAMQGELLERRRLGKHSNFEEPSFFRTSRQIKAECSGIWHNDVLAWEELVDSPVLNVEHYPGYKASKEGVTIHAENLPVQTDCMGATKYWRQLAMDEIKAICCDRNGVGKLTLITQPAHCDLRRTRDGVEGSRSICPRKGLVRVKGFDTGMPSLRWWVW